MSNSTDPNSEALAEALKFLVRRDRFETEIRAHLLVKGMEPEGVLDHLRARRIIDDKKVIQNLIDSYQGKRAIGKDKLRAELLRRGAREEDVEAALEDRPEEDETMIDQLLAKKLKPDDSRAKAGRFLISRGFEEDQIESALARYFGDK